MAAAPGEGTTSRLRTQAGGGTPASQVRSCRPSPCEISHTSLNVPTCILWWQHCVTAGASPIPPACMQVYVWGRRHPYVQLSFLGIFTFTAPYLPWVLLAFSVVLRSSPAIDLLGMVAGKPTCLTKSAVQCRRVSSNWLTL